MSEHLETEEDFVDVEESPESTVEQGATEKPNKVKGDGKDKRGREVSKMSFYWRPHYSKVEELRDLIPRFKEFYYQKKQENPEMREKDVMDAFDLELKPSGREFNPWPSTLRSWRKRWDADIQARIHNARALIMPEQKVLETRSSEGKFLVPTDDEMEGGAMNLGAELMNDAMTMLKSDQQNSDLYEDEVLIKRRNYALNVFNFVMRSVHTKAGLKLKAKQEQRETAAWLMDMVRASTAGKISKEDIELMRNSLNNARPQTYEQPTMATNN